MDLKFRTKAACRIAMIDPQRFNEDVASGDYACAPRTKAGVSRVFDEADIAGLMIYGHLMRVYEPYRFVKKVAALYSCGVIQALRQQTTTNRDRADFPLDGFNDVFTLSNDEDAPSFGAEQSKAPFATICFDLNSILETVRLRMAEEAKILGEED